MGNRADVVRRVARDPQLLRIQISFGGYAFAENSTWLAILLFAYQRGGVGEAGVVAAVQLAPAIIVAPFASYAGDRFRPGRVLAVGYAAQSLAMLATALAMWADRPIAAYVAGAVVASCFTFTRPVMGAILPVMARTPNDLVAANVVTGLSEYLGNFFGPLLSAVVLAYSSPATVFAICAGVVGASALLSARLTLVNEVLATDAPTDAGGVIGELLGGLRAIGSYAALRALVLVLVAGAVTKGINDVLIVMVAESRLDSGGGVAGLLGAAIGLGAAAGAVLAAGLIGQSRLLPYMLAATALTAVPYLVLTGVNLIVPAIVLFIAFGVGESLLRVTTDVGIQRSAPDRVLARVFGVCEGLQMGMIAAGSLLLSVLVEAVGMNTALVLLGVTVGIWMLWGSFWVRRSGGDMLPPPQQVVERLRLDPVFAPIGWPAMATLADRVEVITAQVGDAVVNEGESGDRYYLIVDGTVDVSVGGTFTRTMGAGASFGEIALLRDVPRQATVTCVTPVELLAVGRDDFLTIVTGHPRSLSTATGIAEHFLPE